MSATSWTATTKHNVVGAVRRPHNEGVVGRGDTASVGFLHEEHDPPHGDTDEGYWQVHLAVDPLEKEAVQRIGPTVVPGEHLDLHTELIDGRDSDVVLTMKVFAKTRDDARDRAGYLFCKIRETAGLSQAPTTILGHISPWWKTNSLGDELGREAHKLHQQGRHELAVVRIQTACEMAIAQALTELLAARDPHVDAASLIRRPTILRDPASLGLMHLLTGKQIQQEPWWQDYVEHVKRRNAIVHSGVLVTRDEAFRSLEVNLALRRWLLDAGTTNLPAVADDQGTETPEDDVTPAGS